MTTDCIIFQLWMKPLRESEIIPEERRQDFLEQVFWNIHDIIAVNIRLRDALNKRQKSYAVVEQIGDILLEAVPHFHPFVSYGVIIITVFLSYLCTTDRQLDL